MAIGKELNILYHHRTQGRGAEGVHIVNIVRSLESMGHRVTILSPPGINPVETAGNAPLDKSDVGTQGLNSLWKIISKNLPNFVFELIEVFYNIPAYFRLRKIISSEKYDFIYERYAFFMIAGGIISKTFGIPLVLEVNEISGIKERARKQTFERLCARFERFLFSRCDAIHTVSSYLKSMILKRDYIDCNRVNVTPNAIDLNRFSGRIDNGELRSRLSLEDKLIIGFAGWFDNWDRLDLLVDIYMELKKKFPFLALLLIGDGDVLRMVEKKILKDKIQDVVLTGAVERADVRKYIALLDIAVITHSNEFGSPVVMFEFMGLKIPIVAPALAPVLDVLENREDALLFEPLNTTSCLECLQELITNEVLRKNISEAAYRKLVRQHTWDHNAKHILASAGFLSI